MKQQNKNPRKMMVWKIKHPFGTWPIFTDELLGNGDESHGDESES